MGIVSLIVGIICFVLGMSLMALFYMCMFIIFAGMALFLTPLGWIVMVSYMMYNSSMGQ